MSDADNRANTSEGNEFGSHAAAPISGLINFEIRVRGHLNSHWSEWLEGLEVKHLENGEMILYGPIIDQAALMGILNRLSYLNLAILSVNEANAIEFLEEE